MERIIDNEPMTIEQVCKKYMSLVRYAARKHVKGIKKFGLEYEDLVSFGIEGLLQAYHRFDNDRGLKFMTLCHPYISGTIQRRIRDFGGVVKFTNADRYLAMRIVESGWSELTVEEIMKITGESKEMVISALGYISTPYMSLEQSIASEDDEMTLHEVLGREADFTSVYVDDFINSLSDRCQTIVKMLMENRSQKQIGRVLGCSQMHVSRLLKEIRKQYIAYEKGEEPCKNTNNLSAS